MDQTPDSELPVSRNTDQIESDVISELPTTGSSFHGRQIEAGRYEILSQLGRGGMGEVWQAYDLKASGRGLWDSQRGNPTWWNNRRYTVIFKSEIRALPVSHQLPE